MTDDLRQLAGQMVHLFRQAVPVANAEVDAIIQSGERDTQRIENRVPVKSIWRQRAGGFVSYPEIPDNSL